MGKLTVLCTVFSRDYYNFRRSNINYTVSLKDKVENPLYIVLICDHHLTFARLIDTIFCLALFYKTIERLPCDKCANSYQRSAKNTCENTNIGVLKNYIFFEVDCFKTFFAKGKECGSCLQIFCYFLVGMYKK